MYGKIGISPLTMYIYIMTSNDLVLVAKICKGIKRHTDKQTDRTKIITLVYRNEFITLKLTFFYPLPHPCLQLHTSHQCISGATLALLKL